MESRIQTDLYRQYLSIIDARKLYPPLNGYSAFIQGSEYNTQVYCKKWYDDQVKMDLFIHMKDGFSQVWLPEDDIRNASKFAFKEYLRDPEFFKRRVDVISKNISIVDKLYDTYTYQKVNETDYNTLFALIKEVQDVIWDANAAVIFSIYLDKQLCRDIFAEEKYPISEKELDALWEKGIEPAFESFDKAQLKYFLHLVKENTDWNEVVERCQYFLSDYHSARTLSEVDAKLHERYEKYIGNTTLAVQDLEKEVQSIQSLIDTHDSWLHTISSKENIIAHYLQTVMKVRDMRKNFFAKGITIFYRVAEKMFQEVRIDRKYIPYYTLRELLKGVDYLKSVSDDVISRASGFQWFVPYVGDPVSLNINIDNGVEKINTYFKNAHASVDNLNVIRGQSGCKGVVRGKVRIVLDVNAQHGFTEGEILVAGMTRPEYVSLMKKSAGIITDEGGITCHAAIVSRELKIPCVIGTKIATRIFKNGDMVEVDADKGIVTKL